MNNDTEDLKDKRVLTFDEIQTIARKLGHLTNSQSRDIADAIISVSSGAESINEVVTRIQEENYTDE